MSMPIHTKYPVVLVHGVGCCDRNRARPACWGRIPAALEDGLVTLRYGCTDSWGSVETNAAALCARIDEICAETGAERVNIIAHSKGGLDARAAACAPGYGEKIASITTIGTPHHGSATLDRLFRLPKWFWRALASVVNRGARRAGDVQPDFLAACRGFTTEAARAFNAAHADVGGVLYTSFACAMRSPLSDVTMWPENVVVRCVEGENDGLVAVSSALWGKRAHVVRATGLRGISHRDAIDLRRRSFRARGVAEVFVCGEGGESGEGGGDGIGRDRDWYVNDIRDLYIEILLLLRRHGL